MGAVFVALLANGAGVAAAFSATTLGTFLTTTIAGRLLASVAVSALQAALAPRPRNPGITTEVTQSGGALPSSFILGDYATGGDMVCPPMSHGSTGKTPNAYLTYVISLGDIAGQQLAGMIIDGEVVTFSGTAHADYGTPATGRLAGYAWVKYHDGTQTVADAMLLAKYGSYPERPWTSDMIGTGVCYAIVTFRFNTKLFSGFPQCRFVMTGIPLYDPRKDSTAGGSGSHRWNNRATWELTRNPAVMVYNIKRGIEVPGLGIWGGRVAAPDLPLANWFSAMNSCDVAVSLSAGGTEPAFRAGFEVTVDMEPAAVIEELLRGAGGQVAESGGLWKIRVGGPGLPVWFMTDDDVVITQPQELDPFPTLDQRQNGIAATYPDPEALWEPKEAPPRYSSTWEAEDGGRRLVAALQLNAVPYPNQVQRIMAAYIADERRFRRHALTLPADAATVEPLDTISWTSARLGYAAKLFDVAEVADDVQTLLQRLSLREVDPADQSWSTGMERPFEAASTSPVEPAAQTVPGWAVAPYGIADDTAADRRPAILLTWDGDEMDGCTGLEWEVRLAGGAAVSQGATTNVSAGEAVISDGLLAATEYEVRARQVALWATDWTDWEAVTTDDILLGRVDVNGTHPQAGVVGPLTMSGGAQVQCTLSWGPTGASSIWLRGVTFRARKISGALATVTLKLQRRTKEAGTWSAWIDRNTWDITSSAWDQYTSSATVVGNYEDVEERLLSDCSDTQTNALSNITMIATDIIK
ncbi:phage tail protein [Tabrizicola fusiformis]|uniref:phage tail protein n=1 Tax=Tabrizicola sp. SY72 TaxID=2741673 RepID=UPI0015716595|nr:phage tail protein [Tabrizicola sp. SY72]NTT86929.1 hypothetical protein [Tabrizicola sp. SY72]